ncbi:hypothetical protein GCM10022403_028320 [Streptomyces coacervatus]|uniref:Uncharacterized protein n=1 Tax=Streptomyces coacervatus TaxID=647381 RepID=A0ABP7HF12_9ACTN
MCPKASAGYPAILLRVPVTGPATSFPIKSATSLWRRLGGTEASWVRQRPRKCRKGGITDVTPPFGVCKFGGRGRR